MVWRKHDYDDIPGTYVFNGENAYTAFGLNKLLFSFNHEENRKAFEEDPAAYADRFKLTDEQREALLGKDFLQMLRLGANIYYVAKMAIPNGVSVQDAGAAFQGISTEEFKAKLAAHYEGLEDKLEKEGGFWNG
jgi:protocatechuate 4,5-dioxygenase alpha chain